MLLPEKIFNEWQNGTVRKLAIDFLNMSTVFEISNIAKEIVLFYPIKAVLSGGGKEADDSRKIQSFSTKYQ